MSFRLKTILGIAIIEMTLLIILIFSVLSFLNSSHEEELNQRASSTVKLFATMSKDAVIAYDLANLEDFISEILKNDDVVYARILNDSTVLAQGGDALFLNKPFVHDHLLATVDDGVFDAFAVIKESGYAYGRVEIGLSIDRIQQVLAQVRQWVIVIAVIEVTLVSIFSFILGTWLTRQLMSLKKASETIALKGPGCQVETHGSDEVAQVAHAFNKMSSRLQRSYSDLKHTSIAYQKMAELASQSEALNATVLSASLDAVVTIDSNGKFIEYNQSAEEIFGYSKDQVMGESMAELIVPREFRALHHQELRRYLETGRGEVLNKRLELKGLRKNGEIFPIELTITPIEAQGKIFFTAFVRDITEQENARKELRVAAQAFEAQEAIFISDADNRIIRVNKAFTRITGYSSDEIIGHSPKKLSSGTHDAAFYQSMWSAIGDKGSWEGEIYNMRKNGDIYPEWLGISVVKDEEGKRLYYIAHFIDISKRKAAEQELKNAMEEAEKANEAKSHFLATMSHEIRTPMNAILGTLGLVQETKLDSEQDKFIKTAQGSAKSLLHIINDILDFSKIEADKLAIEEHAFSLSTLVKNIEDILSVKAKKQNNQIITMIDDEIPDIIKSDPGRLEQVILNLMTNAVKFTKNGKIILHISKVEQKSAEITLRFEIKDDGIGIHEADQETLFDEFTQVDGQSNRRFEGTGLGLAICKKIIHLLGGNIGLESQLGQGSLFWFTIPVVADETMPDKTVALIDDEPLMNQSLNILLAEDSEANVIVAMSILEKAGHKVDVVENGIEAIMAVENTMDSDHFYDVILMDLMMPEMDGLTATRQIKTLPEPLSSIPIIAMTANAMKGDKERCLDVGMDDYLSKPFDTKVLLRKIQRLTENNIHDAVMPEIAESLPSYKSLPILDKNVLKQMAQDTSEELVPEMVNVFIKELNTRLQKINKAINDYDHDVIGQEVHALKSSSGTYGAKQLQELANAIDLTYKSSENKKLFELTTQLPDLLNNTMDIYRNEYPLSL